MTENKNWLTVFLKFIELLRIDSKENVAEDNRGSQLKIWGSQRVFLEQLSDGLNKNIRSFVFLKARQLGITTISLAIDVFWMAMYPGMVGCLVADTESNREVFRSTIRRYIESFPKGFFGKSFTIVKGGDNRNFMKFSNGSRLDFLVAGTRSKKTWGEGRGYAFAHSTETANYGSAEGLMSFRETLADTHPNRLFIYESTAKGNNHFKDMYEEAGRDTITKRRAFIGWYHKEINTIARKDPLYGIYGVAEASAEEQELIDLVKDKHDFDITKEQLAWYRWRCADNAADQNAIHQNLPWYDAQAFVLSGFSFFQVRLIGEQLERIMGGKDENGDRLVKFKAYRLWLGNDFWASKMEHIVDQERLGEVELRVWEDPAPGGKYVIGCDAAFGRNDWKDRSAISVFRCFADKLVQVAEYADNKYETHQTAWVLAYLADIYPDCIVNVELTGGPGRAVLREFDSLRERFRAEVYQPVLQDHDREDFLYHARHYLYKKSDSYGGGNVKSFDTNGRSKFEIMNQLRDSHSTRVLLVNSAPLCNEMLDVVQDGYEIGAPGRNKDDRVFAAALANRVWIDDVRNPMTQQGLTYERVLSQEYQDEEDRSQGPRIIDNLVANFFKNAAERAEDPTPEQQWMDERGLI